MAAFEELARHGLGITRLVVNKVVQVADSPYLEQKRREQQPHLERLRTRCGNLPIVEIPLFPQEVRGVERLRGVCRLLMPAV